MPDRFAFLRANTGGTLAGRKLHRDALKVTASEGDALALAALVTLLLLYASSLWQGWIPLGPEKVKLLFFPAVDGVVVYAAWRASRRCEGFSALRTVLAVPGGRVGG